MLQDFLLRFASCTNATDYTTCKFSNVRTGLIGELFPFFSVCVCEVSRQVKVSMLSIGTAVGALIGASLADKLGRRRAITIGQWCRQFLLAEISDNPKLFTDCVVVSIGTVIQVASIHSWEQVSRARPPSPTSQGPTKPALFTAAS